jgi:hypothetical protein
MSDRESGDDQRRDKLLLRLLKTPPKPRPKRERDKGKVVDETPVITGVLPPPGFRWRILGKWPDGRTEDILREMDQEVSPLKPFPRPPRTERKARHSSRSTSQVAGTRQKNRS